MAAHTVSDEAVGALVAAVGGAEELGAVVGGRVDVAARGEEEAQPARLLLEGLPAAVLGWVVDDGAGAGDVADGGRVAVSVLCVLPVLIVELRKHRGHHELHCRLVCTLHASVRTPSGDFWKPGVEGHAVVEAHVLVGWAFA
jgi:hypothetical protein